ncbi:MAG: hypothetical protein ACRC30_00505 [Clostridium sp.]
MAKLTIYTESLNYLGKRIFIAEINKKNNVRQIFKELNNPEISEEDLLEINNLIEELAEESEIVVYTLGAYQNKQNELKKKWIGTEQGKRLEKLKKSKNIRLEKYIGELGEKRKELKNLLINKFSDKKNLKLNNEEIRGLDENKIYNYNYHLGGYSLVDIYLRGSLDLKTKEGGYVAIIKSGENVKKIVDRVNGTSSNEIQIKGLIKAIEILKKPCLINLKTHAHIGFSKIEKNLELKKELINIIEANKHSIIEIVSNDRQEELAKLLDELK